MWKTSLTEIELTIDVCNLTEIRCSSWGHNDQSKPVVVRGLHLAVHGIWCVDDSTDQRR